MSATRVSQTADFGTVADREIRPASRSLAALAATIAVAATVVVTVVPGLDKVQSSAPASAAIDTAAIIALGLTAAIVAGRARRAASWSDLLLADGFLVMALATLFLSLVPDINQPSARTFAVWAGTATRLFGVALLLGAAFARPRPLEVPGAEMRRGLLGAALSAAVVTLVIGLIAARLPAVPAPVHHRHISRDILAGPASLTATEGVLGTALLIASVGFARRAELLQDALLGWVAAGLALAAFSRLGFMLFPSQTGDYLYIGDFLGLAASLVLLIGASIDVLGRQEALAEAAVRDDRRRIARDLHDGLAQELAFISTQTRRLFPGTAGRPEGQQLLASAERALEESRLAISGLVREEGTPLEQTLENAATSAASRAGIELIFDCQGDISVSPELQQAMLRVQAQAIVNAAVHGRARRVHVSVRADPATRLSITDDGDGFDPDAERRPDSIGLTSMRERTEALGGELIVRSAPGEGTTVIMVVP